MDRWCQSHLLQEIALATALNQHVAKNRKSRPPYFHFLKLDLTPYLLLDSPSFFQRPLKMGSATTIPKLLPNLFCAHALRYFIN